MTNAVVNFGCRLNHVEADAIENRLARAGERNILVFNTCAVTNEAVRQVRQAIRRARRAAPKKRLVVTGCAAHIAPSEFAAMPEVDAVIGNDAKFDAAAYGAVRRRVADEAASTVVGDITRQTPIVPYGVSAKGRTRAALQVQNGCDHRCTFCIIPFGRGPARSLPPAEAVRRARNLVASGHREIVLTGVDLTSYGRDLSGDLSLGGLVKRLLREVPDLSRLRLSSVDSVEIDADLIAAFGREERLMPHLHLSLQAGDDMILKRMKRRHGRADAIDMCNRLRALRPDVVFGADMIAGFPTETEDMFQRSLDLVEEAGITYLHTFPFSPRPGTPAASMPQVSSAIIKERAARLRTAGARRFQMFLAREVGRERELLIERAGIGRSAHFTRVDLGSADCPPVGHLVRARITAVAGDRLIGAPLAWAA